jgi:HAD superfamily hydrolase (TIGR01509 family)
VVRAVLFDLDGVLADTERLHWAAYRDVLLEYGVDVGIEEYRHRFIINGGGPEYACRTYRLAVTPHELRARKAERYLTRLRAGVRVRPGARAALARLHATHRTAIATNAERAEVDFIVDRLGLADVVDVTIARCDYARPKPAPDAYLAAAAALGFAPPECVVVEDTPRGLQAGRAAGMAVIAVPNDLTADADFTGSAHRLEGLDQLTAALLG